MTDAEIVLLVRPIVLSDGVGASVTRLQHARVRLTWIDDPTLFLEELHHASPMIGEWTVSNGMVDVIDATSEGPQ